ncbi:hypothetical protein SAMN04488024_102140 [Pedobacter soli]|uniref:Uncharacterized protein n=1 Tax=Pedobacter soli TaxID=390242 RepID=A0A1G6LVN1_9SPHI|nr:hypothetical protein SAMN04488024_102140 [Pedobacter soli]
MTIEPLITLMPENLLEIVRELILLKSTSNEGFLIKIVPQLSTYIDHEFEKCSAAAKDLPKESFSGEALDIFFRKTIKSYDN